MFASNLLVNKPFTDLFFSGEREKNVMLNGTNLQPKCICETFGLFIFVYSFTVLIKFRDEYLFTKKEQNMTTTKKTT